MARAPAVMDENDGDDGHVEDNLDLPAGLTGSTDTPRGRDAKGGDVDYAIVDADDNFKPLTGPAAAPAVDEIRAEEAEGDDDNKTFVRKSKADRRRAQREARGRLDDELNRFRDENVKLRADMEALRTSVSPRLDRIDQARIDDQLRQYESEIASTAQAVENAITRMSDAMASGDAAAHTAALRDHTKAVTRGSELTQARKQLEASRDAVVSRTQPQDQGQGQQQQRQQPPPQQRPAPMDPEVERRTQDFAGKYRWLKLDRPDRDTKLALIIDAEVAEDGFDPRDDDYWEELEARMKEAPQLTHKFQAPQRRAQAAQPARQQNVAPERRGPMVGGSSNGGSQQGAPRQVLLSPERKQTLIQVGVLDPDGRTIVDREKFNRLAKRYDEYDRANGVAR